MLLRVFKIGLNRVGIWYKHVGLFGLLFLLSFITVPEALAQSVNSHDKLWHDKERTISYRPDGEDFVLVKGDRRFNRALYGTNSGFRVETGDLPEFALYLPGMGGNMKFGIISGNKSKWIIDADSIETRFRPGTMLYKIKDTILGSGALHLSVLAQADAEGMIIKATFVGVLEGVELFWAFGGATGKRFSRDGDIGRDPESSFYLKPENCNDNVFTLSVSSFKLDYGSGKPIMADASNKVQQAVTNTKSSEIIWNQKQLSGVFPLGASLHIADATKQHFPLTLSASMASNQPVLSGRIHSSVTKDLYFFIQVSKGLSSPEYAALPDIYAKAEKERLKLASRIKVSTPDPYINTFGGALGIAADAIWEAPTYLHGAIAWRTQLNGWRGASVADPLGWHERAKMHFENYENSQVLSPSSGTVMPDTALNFARQVEKIGTAVFSSGYISSKPNNNNLALHYDMNLIFFDQMLRHISWNGDVAFAKEMWPAIKRHLAWEKRNFDMDGDGLYDAYAAIWASDAMQYSGGGVTHTSAYNYKANKMAAKLAKILGEDPAPYQQEADKILKAINQHLWLPQKGCYAENKDLLGLKLVHPNPGLWTIYHAIDSEVPDPFQAYQVLKYVDDELPHIPIKAKGLPGKNYYTIPTTNWQPYTWSLNNVATAEVFHTTLAYWQAGRSEEAYKLWESMVIENLYLSNSPGGFKMLSFYDAIIGEYYRDFADPIGMAGRSLVEGLFGIRPDALSDTLTIQPGLPADWSYASLKIPDVTFDYQRTGKIERFVISPNFPRSMHLRLILKAKSDQLKSISVNGKNADWKIVESAVGNTAFEIAANKAESYKIVIEWAGKALFKPKAQKLASNAVMKLNFSPARVLQVFDPQDVMNNEVNHNSTVEGLVNSTTGKKTVFAKLQQGDFVWWEPLFIDVTTQVQILADEEQTGKGLSVTLKNTGNATSGYLSINKGNNAYNKKIHLTPNSSVDLKIPASYITPGTNLVRFELGDGTFIEKKITNWSVEFNANAEWKKVDLSPAYNDVVTNIFKNKYLSPRPTSPTLQIPLQGIGNWCYPLTAVDINDSGLRAAASVKNEITIPIGIPFLTPSAKDKKNIVFVSQWDNYPDTVNIPLQGKASHAYLLMAGSTNPMQSRLNNGVVLISYTDGTSESLELKNPETWWPIEQDYYTDDFAFGTGGPRPYRVNLKTAEVSRQFKKFYTIQGFSSYGIEGGAATVLDLTLNPEKELKEIKIIALANEVVIGLMSLTLCK